MRVLVDKQKLSRKLNVEKENLYLREVLEFLQQFEITNFIREDDNYYMFEIPDGDVVINSYNGTVFYTSRSEKFTLIDMGLWVEVKLQ